MSARERRRSLGEGLDRLISSAAMPTATDFLILTPLAEERAAVLAELPGHELLPPEEGRTLVYVRASVPVRLADGREGAYSVVVFSPLEMSTLPAALAIEEALRSFAPRYVLVVGIAGGVKGRSAIGDVLIADQIAGYEVQKVLPDDEQIRWRAFPVDPSLLAAAKSRLPDEWWQGTRIERPDKGRPELRFGPVVSGDKIIARREMLMSCQSQWPQLVGVEMEGVGVGYALYHRPRGPGFLMIRGVSDLADKNKNKSATRRWRAYASAVAARCALALIKSGPIPFGPGTASQEPGAELPSRLETESLEAESLSSRLLSGMSGYPAAGRIRNLLSDYVGTSAQTSTFGGRQQELDLLNKWLADESAPQRLLLCAPAGIGKTALLCRWGLDLTRRSGLRIAWFPISNRYDTRLEADLMPALLARLAHLHGVSLPDQRRAGSAAWRMQLHELLRRQPTDGQQLLLVLDGLDEAADWTPDRTLVPQDLPSGVRILVAARQLAGDEGESGWLRRLGWRRKDVRCLSLSPLSLAEVRDVAQTLGLALRHDMESSTVVAALHKLSEGDPLVLRLRVEDLVAALPAGTLPEVEKLKSLPKGLDGYLEELCGPDVLAAEAASGPAVALQGLVALAKAPLLRADLRALAPELTDATAWHQALTRLRRILIGDGVEQGFVYSHSCLRDYFERRLSDRDKESFRARFVAYTKKCLEGLRAGSLEPTQLSPYVLTCSSAHFREAGAEAAVQLSLVSEVWLRAWFAREQGYDGFLHDVGHAQEAAEEAFLRTHAEPALLGIVRCILCRQIIKDQSEHLYPDLLRALLEERLWTAARALAALRHTREGGGTSFRELMHVVAEFLPEALLWDASALTLDRQQTLHADAARSLALLAPRLARAQPERAVLLAGEIHQDWFRMEYLLALLPSLSGPLRETVLGWALRLIRPEPGSGRAHNLVTVAKALSEGDPRADPMFREAWQQAGRLEPVERMRHWEALSRELPPPYAAQLLSASLDEVLERAEPYLLALLVGTVMGWDAALGSSLLNRMAAHARARPAVLNWASAVHESRWIDQPPPDPCARWQYLRERLEPARYVELRSALTPWMLEAKQFLWNGLALLEAVAAELSPREREELRLRFHQEPILQANATGLCLLAPYGDAASRLEAFAAVLTFQRYGEDLRLLKNAVARLDVDQLEPARTLVTERLADAGPGDERALYARTFCWIYLSDRDDAKADELRRQAKEAAAGLSYQPNKAQVLYALAIRATGEAQQSLLADAAQCADDIPDPKRRHETLRLIALGLNEPWREHLLRHAMDGLLTWSQRAHWHELELLLTRFEISDSLRSEIIARAKRLVTAPDDGTMYWHDYLGVAGLCAGGERHAAVQRAVDAALKWDNLDSVVFAIAKLSPEEPILSLLLEKIAAAPSPHDQIRLSAQLYPVSTDRLQAEIRAHNERTLSRVQREGHDGIDRLAQLADVIPAGMRGQFCSTLFSLTRSLVEHHGALLKTPKEWLPMALTGRYDQVSGALRTAVKALVLHLTQHELDEVLGWIPMRAKWSDVLSVLIACVESEERRRVLFDRVWGEAQAAPPQERPMHLAWLAPNAPLEQRSSSIAEALSAAHLTRYEGGSSVDSRPTVLRALAAHLSAEHLPLVLKQIRGIFCESSGPSAFNLAFWTTQVPCSLQSQLADTLLGADSFLTQEQQFRLRLVIAASDEKYLPATLQEFLPLMDPLLAAKLAELAPVLSDSQLREALDQLLSCLPNTHMPVDSLGTIVQECERRGWDVRDLLARTLLQSLNKPEPGLHYLLPRIGSMASSLAVLGIRPAALAETIVMVMEWFSRRVPA